VTGLITEHGIIEAKQSHLDELRLKLGLAE